MRSCWRSNQSQVEGYWVQAKLTDLRCDPRATAGLFDRGNRLAHLVLVYAGTSPHPAARVATSGDARCAKLARCLG
jgi:hypothetical protein